MDIRSATGVAACLLGIAWATPALGLVFTVDEFRIERNGSTFFYDDFSDGVPPAGPGVPPFTYSVNGVVSESGGQLVMDTSLGTPNVLFQGGLPGRSVTVTHTSENRIDRPNDGLRVGHAIRVEALFDLTAPAGVWRYGIRLGDRFTPAMPTGNPPPQEGDDMLELAVRRALDGNLYVQFRELDFVALTSTEIAQVLLAPGPNETKIGLMLERNTPDGAGGLTNDVTASFVKGNFTDGITFSHTFSTAGDPRATLFNGEDWARGGLIASEFFVPEPGSMALLGMGLVSLFAVRRKRLGA